ncbi:MAG: hypothetical protein ACNA7O_02015 [Rhodobacterales bacterium]
MKKTVLTLLLTLWVVPSALWAEQPALDIELNAAQDREGGCRMSFVAMNGLGSDLSALVLEAVIFTPEGGVDRLALLDFQELPHARPRVRQFDLPDLACSQVGQVLINAVNACSGADLTPETCSAAITLRSRLDTIAITG